MRSLSGQVSCTTWGRVVIAAVALLAAVQTATAEDGDFFSSIFGGGTPQPAPQTYAPPAEPVEQPVYRRPLTVKLHRPKVMRETKVDKTVGKVSIYQDRTLRRGDAVMTAKGIRIFAGSPLLAVSRGRLRRDLGRGPDGQGLPESPFGPRSAAAALSRSLAVVGIVTV